MQYIFLLFSFLIVFFDVLAESRQLPGLPLGDTDITVGENQMVQKQQMIQEILAEIHDTQNLTGKSALSPKVLAAIQTIPREKFVPKRLREKAYLNIPLPIGNGQTISQPYIVAIMTELLEITSDDRVLEVGTGSGYQAAILSKLAKEIYTIEIIPELGNQAKKIFEKLGYTNIHVSVKDGAKGWKEHAPFNAIIVTAVAPSVPQSLLDQLVPEGRMVIPIIDNQGEQYLIFVRKDKAGKVHHELLLPVRFVPLTN